ncbi:unnamed protein product [Penicillium salamii]|uniref:Zn(2)-C6 fungal-type domain-containing protein n=1 Tax=Penicillium salamii TaxID=1612424 RepID=A0A9W4JBU2_9EURO|nr:unnamed protein product [Penicillium salamii]CAG8362943.1 unnamed protein product [Penicillium salamii]CAG8369851.1 unnamed protein product [Penicillium salamii]CAG8390168.1 unnamed protein product [Penicillium salamii]
MHMDMSLHESCWTCRNRHVQCDRSQMPCAKCQKAGLECLKKLPFRWVKGVAIRGNMQGHTYENNSAAPVTKPKRFRFKSSGGKAAGRRSAISMITHSPIPSPGKRVIHSLSAMLILYVPDNKRLCANFVVYDSDKNQLRKLIPLALQNPILGKVILALAARHLANHGQTFGSNLSEALLLPETMKYDRDALLFKHHAIAGLSNALGDPKQCYKDINLASVFLLVLLDLLESGGEEWQVHLHGAKSLITSSFRQPPLDNSAKQESTHVIPDTRDFVIQHIVLIDTLGSIFPRPKSPSQELTLGQTEMAQDSIEYSFLACPELLRSAIRSISRERDSVARCGIFQGTDVQAYIQAILVVVKLAENFDCVSWASRLKQPRHTREDTHFLAVVAQVYKIATLLYGRRVISALEKKTISQDELILELLGLLNSLKDRQELLKCVLWPVFVAGLECRSPEQKQFFISRLEEFWMTTNCLNVINAAKILQEYWSRDDWESICWAFDVGRFGQAWLLI